MVIDKEVALPDVDQRTLEQSGEELRDDLIDFGSRVMAERGKASKALREVPTSSLARLLTSATSAQDQATQIKKAVQEEMLERDELRRAQERDAREARENDSTKPMKGFGE